jgi:hypothetical protein
MDPTSASARHAQAQANRPGLPYFEAPSPYPVVQHVLDTYQPAGTAIEFGTGSGESTRLIAAHMRVISFDSFEGLPEKWRDGYEKGSCQYPPPDIDNATLVAGWFADTLPHFSFDGLDIGLVHFDADLYSSTATALQHVGPHLRAGCFIIFDEFQNHPDAEQDEQRAWEEYVEQIGVTWEPVAHGYQELAIKLTKVPGHKL